MENNLCTTARKLCQIINRNNSLSHRLPPETLAMVASHLEDDASLIAATHVCHLWRAALLSSPRLWSHLSFVNEKRALVFLERSKSVPLYVDLTGADNPSETVQELLRTIGTRVTALRGWHSPFLDVVLHQSTPVLELLDLIEVDQSVPRMPIQSFPSLKSLIIFGSIRAPFRAPCLTTFRLTYGVAPPPQGGRSNSIAKFLRDCPLLEEVYVKYHEDRWIFPNLTTDARVSIPSLRSFTHASSYQSVEIGLFNRLSLPPTCQVAFATSVAAGGNSLRFPNIPTLQDPFDLSNIACAKVTARSNNPGSNRDILHVLFIVELVNSRGARISFEVESGRPANPSDYSLCGFPIVSERVEICSAKTLCLDNFGAPQDPMPEFNLVVTGESITQALQSYGNLETLILVESTRILFLVDFDSCSIFDTLVVYSSPVRVPPEVRGSVVDIIDQVGSIAVGRREAGFPIKALILVFGDDEETLRECQGELEKLKSCVGHVQVVSGADALDWDVDEYFLG